MSDSNISTPLELAILGLLAQRPRTGYDLMKVFAETAMGSFTSSPGAIYPALKRLERRGCIGGEVQRRNTLRPRQVYRLMNAGAESLRQHLQRPVTREDVMRRPDVVLLQFALAGEVLGPREAVAILEQFAREIEAYLPDLRAQLAEVPETGGPYGRYALQRGIDGYSADARWARKVIEELNEQAARRSSQSGSRSGRQRGAWRKGAHRS